MLCRVWLRRCRLCACRNCAPQLGFSRGCDGGAVRMRARASTWPRTVLVLVAGAAVTREGWAGPVFPLFLLFNPQVLDVLEWMYRHGLPDEGCLPYTCVPEAPEPLRCDAHESAWLPRFVAGLDCPHLVTLLAADVALAVLTPCRTPAGRATTATWASRGTSSARRSTTAATACPTTPTATAGKSPTPPPTTCVRTRVHACVGRTPSHAPRPL